MPAPLPVSVVIPACNAAGTLPRALASVEKQTAAPAEIVVVDDASTDDTAAVAQAARQVRLVRAHFRGGAAKARNEAVHAASMPWIAFLDADDEWLPEKLERQFGLIGANPSAVLLFCASLEFAADGRALGDTFRGAAVSTGRDAWKSLLKANFVATPTVLAPRELLLALGGFDESLAVGEDQDMWIRLALAGGLAYVPEPLVRVHVQPRSLSAFRQTDQSRYLIPMIERHLCELRDRLSATERREILGERLCNAGRIALANGDVVGGARFMLRAAKLGYRPLASVLSIARTPASALARRVLQALPRRETAH